jgi:sigma-B regulation protein RsbU (phosphoserine phosphatase)
VVNKRGVGAFQQEDLDLLITLADQAASTVELVRLSEENAETQRLEQELKLAHDIQQMLLPNSCPQPDGFSIAAFSAPALEVGGDYYDFIWVDEEKKHLGIAIADVSGKGIPGALIMAVVRCTMRATASGNFSPRDVLIRVNERVYADTGENVFVTITYGILDVQSRKFTFSRAGHEPLVMVGRDSDIKLTSPTGIAMGLVESDMFSILEETTVTFERGDTAILYTDGVVEAMDSKNNEYGQKRFFDLIERNRTCRPQDIIRKTLDDISAFIAGNPQHDDITLVAVRLDAPVEQDQNPVNANSHHELLTERGRPHERI